MECTAKRLTQTITQLHATSQSFVNNKGSLRDAPKMGMKTYKQQKHQEPSLKKVASVWAYMCSHLEYIETSNNTTL